MDRTPIYLEKDDEITSVVDKLKNTDAVYLDVVIPKEAIMLQSVINLKLLKRQAESLGKEVTIVTQDKVGAKLAEQVGIPVVAKEGQLPKEVNVTESDEAEYSEEDIQMKPEQAKKPVQEKKEEEAIDEPESLPKSTPQKIKSSDPSWFKKHRKKVLIGGGFALIAIFLAAYIYVPLANVNIKLAAEKRSVDISFRASRDARNVDLERDVVPAREITQEIEKSENFQATGERDAGERATGRVTIFNNFSTTAQNLNAGDRINAAGGLSFVLVSNVVVPGYTDPGNRREAGSIPNVAVRAIEAGERYNIAAGTRFSIARINSQNFYAENPGAFTGGSTRKVKFVTAADIEKAKEATKTAAENELKTKIEESANEALILEGAINVSEVSATSSLAANAEGTEFTYNIKLRGVALSVNQDDIKSLAEGRLKQEIGETKEIVEAGQLISSTKVTEFNAERGEFSANLTGEAYIAAKINQDELKNAINGQTSARAIEHINEIEGVESVEVSFFPRFYNRVPRINDHIYIKIEILRAEPEQTTDGN